MYYSVNPWKKLFTGLAFKSPSNILLQMVTWNELSQAIRANSERFKTVETIQVPDEKPVEQYPYYVASSTETQPPTLQIHTVNQTVDSIPAVNVMGSPINTVEYSASYTEELAAEPIEEPPMIAVPIIQPTPPQPIRVSIPQDTLNLDEPKAPKATREPVSLKHEVDPIVIGIEETDILYTGAPANAKHRMACEEAQRIEGLLAELYKSQGGRSRGWTKGGLEEWIKPRCASGGNIRELDRAKVAFAWQLVCEDKAMSAFLDFLCVAKKIRIAIWFSEEKRVVVYPASDYASAEPTLSYPLYHVDSKGHLRKGMKSSSDLVQFCEDNHYTMIPAITVMAALSKLTLDELASVAEKLGMVNCLGNKKERVAKIASYKLRQRLGAHH